MTHHPECEDATGEYPGSCTCALIKRREAMDDLIAQDADLIDVEAITMTEITEADCNVAEYIAGDRVRDVDYQVVARHRQQATEALQASNEQWQVDYNEAVLDNLKLRAENAHLLEALHFYAYGIGHTQIVDDGAAALAAIRTNFCLNCETQANTTEELRAANERWVIAFKQAEERANGRIEVLREKLRNLLDLDRRCGWHSKEADEARAALQETE